MEIIKDELREVREKYADERRTELVLAAGEFRMEDMIAEEDVVITISHLGYIKRTPLSEYKVQNRGGVGSRGSSTRDEDFLEQMFVSSTHNYILFFTEKGMCYWLKAYEIPEGNKTSKGRAIQNVINLQPGDKVKAYIRVHDLADENYLNNNFIVMCTKKGVIKKTTLEAYSRPRQNGIIAINVREGDTLLEAVMTDGKSEIMLASKEGKVCRFPEEKVRPMGRGASGVTGMNLDEESFPGNEVIGMIAIADPSSNVLVVSEKGFGKRSDIEEYRITNRGGKGVKTINITEKTGKLIAIKSVTDENDLMIITREGLTIRMKVKDLRVMGRATQGVRLINLREEDNIGAVAKVDADDEEDGSSEQPLNEGGEVQPQAEGDENNGKEIDNDGEETKNPE